MKSVGCFLPPKVQVYNKSKLKSEKGAEGHSDESMVHEAESKSKHRVHVQGTHKLYNIPHIIQCVRVCIQAQTLCIYIYRRLYIYTHRGNSMLSSP